MLTNRRSTEAKALTEDYLARLRSRLDGLPFDEREGLVARVQAQIELEQDLQHALADDVEATRAVLARLGSPEDYARTLRLREAVSTEAPTARPALTACRTCGGEVSAQAVACPHCGAPFPARRNWKGSGFEWKSKAHIGKWPLVHVAVGRDENGKLRVAKGVIAIGQFGIGAITIAQFGVGLVGGLGQFMLAPLALGQFAIGLVAAGQFALGLLAGAGMFATGLWAWGLKTFRWFG